VYLRQQIQEAAGMVAVLLDVREDGVGGCQVVLHPVGGPGEGGQEGGEGDGPGPGGRAEQGQSQERQLPAHNRGCNDRKHSAAAFRSYNSEKYGELAASF
jgi:hypothetical protein